MHLKDDVKKNALVECECCPYQHTCDEHDCPTVWELFNRLPSWKDNFIEEYCRSEP